MSAAHDSRVVADVPASTDADPLASSLAAAHERLEETTRTYPWPTIAAAVGVGVVLGGGIPSWALRLAATTAVRAVAVQAAQSLFTPPSAD